MPYITYRLCYATFKTGSEVKCVNSGWPVFNGRFKALVELSSGLNRVLLKFGDQTLTIFLTYTPAFETVPRCSYFVRPVYIQCVDDALGSFQVKKTFY